MLSENRHRELVLWVALAVVSLLPAFLSPGAVVGRGVDAYGTWWFFWWIRTCVERLGDPSTTNLFFYPDTKDVFAHTGNNFVDAVLSVPFQWVFGEHYFPFFVLVVLVGNAVAFRALAEEALPEGVSRVAATVLWAVNPFTIAELTAGRVTQVFLWFVPVAVLAFLRTARTGSLRDAVMLGVATALSAWTYWFNGFFLVLAFAGLAPWALARAHRGEAGPTLGRAVGMWILGGAVCLLIVAPAVYGMARAASSGQVIGQLLESGSVANPLARAADRANGVMGFWAKEPKTPMLLQPAWGLVALVAAVIPGVRLVGGRGRWIALAAVTMAFAFGPAIFIEGATTLRVPWYSWAQTHVPFFDRLWFPYRIVVFPLLAAALLNGALCARLRWPRAALASLVALSLGGQAFRGEWPVAAHNAHTPEMMASLRTHGGGVIFLPMRVQHDGLMWQTRFQLPTFGGMAESSTTFWTDGFKRRMANRFVKALRGATLVQPIGAPWRPADREKLRRDGFRWVVLRPSLLWGDEARLAGLGGTHPRTPEALRGTIRGISAVIGEPPRGQDRDAVLWDLAGRWTPDPAWAPSDARVAAMIEELDPSTPPPPDAPTDLPATAAP